MRIRALMTLATLSVMTAPALAGDELEVLSVFPPQAALDADASASLTITFDRPIDPKSVTPNAFHAFSRGAGALVGAFRFSSDGRSVTLDPNINATRGEPVTVTVSNAIRGLDGTPMRSAGFQWRYFTSARPSDMDFSIIQETSTRANPSETVIPYGGCATDLDGDGWVDLSIVNEGTNDVRVFMNRGDGSGEVDQFLQPGNPVGNTPSPSEAADFNLDGLADLCTANLQGDSISILIGNGDGTYQPAQTPPAGNQPRGITTLDADGDGDIDIVSTNASSGNAMFWRNNGDGTFANPVTFQPGISQEWSVQADDMDGDGIFDLVFGGSNSVRVMMGDGTGNFTTRSTTSVAARAWQMNLADLDADGDVDVAIVAAFANVGQIFKNSGNGSLSSATTYSTDNFPLATDLGDLDGDGDLDWITSSYGGDWFIFTNNGSGTFQFHEEILAPVAASCSLPVDMDNDGDLDLVFIDELGDWLIIMSNSGNNGPELLMDLNADGLVNGEDIGLLLASWGSCPPDSSCPADANDDGFVDGGDMGILLVEWTG